MTMPSVFVSHGAPTLAIEDGPAHRFLGSYGARLGKPRGILVLSAHFEAPAATVTSGETPETIHDFRGFPAALFEVRYPAPGDPALAARVAALLGNGDIAVHGDPRRGLDHGAWVPLLLMYPDADVPVVQLSIDPRRGPAYHLELGARLAPLADDDVLVLGSGSATHNLALVLGPERPAAPPGWTVEFNEWLADRLAAGAVDEVVNYRETAPFAAQNHPTEEHFFPLLAALGAGGPGARGRRVHSSYTYGALSMDAYEFALAAD